MSSVESPEDKTPTAWDADAWRTRCDALAKNANKGCGLSYDLFVEMFSGGVKRHLDGMPEEWKADAETIARDFGYATPAELEKMRDEQAAMGCCSHGLDPDCCPAGCGDLDSGHDDDWDFVWPIDHFDQLLFQLEADFQGLAERFDLEIEEALAPLKG